MLEIIRSKKFLKEFEAVMKSSKPSLRKRIDERFKKENTFTILRFGGHGKLGLTEELLLA